MDTDPEEPSRALARLSPRLTIARTVTESYSVEHKTMRTEISETEMHARIGVARARYAWPVVAVTTASALVAIVIAVISLFLKYNAGLVVAGAIMAPAAVTGALRTLGVQFGSGNNKAE